jgi:hypothetical protein
MKKGLNLKKTFYVTEYFWLCIVLGVIIACSPVFATESANEITTKKVLQKDQKKGKESVPAMVFKHGKLTVHMPSTTLNQAMKELCRVTGIEVLWMRPESNVSVSLGLNDKPVIEAVRHILDGENYMLLFSSQDREEVISRILILPKSDGDDRTVPLAQFSTGMDTFTKHEFGYTDEVMTDEMDIMEQERIEWMNSLDKVGDISMLDELFVAEDEL